MAKLKNGLFGAPSGKFGKNIIFSSWLGTPYMKSNPGKRTAPNEKEKKNHRTFGRDSWDFIKPLKELFQISFREHTQGNRGMFAARSYLLKHALEKDELGNAVILPEKMLVSRGSLGSPQEIEVQQESPVELLVSWNPYRKNRISSNNDELLVVAYNVAAGEALIFIGPAFRKDGSTSIELSGLPAGSAHLYLGFLSYDRTRASDSVYLGTVEI